MVYSSIGVPYALVSVLSLPRVDTMFPSTAQCVLRVQPMDAERAVYVDHDTHITDN